MADPIWVDTVTIGYIAAGDTALEAELVKLAAGGKVMMVPKVKEEVSLGNPFKTDHQMGPTDGSQARDEVIKRLNIQVDTMGSATDRREFFEKQFKFKESGKTPVVRGIEESDAIILSEVAASAKARNIANPRFLTGEKRLVNNADAKLWKVNILSRSSTPNPPGSSGGGLPSPTGDIHLTLSTSPRGQANAVATVAVFIIVDSLFRYLNTRFLSEEVGEQLKATESRIRTWQADRPGDGALVSVNFKRTEQAPDPLGVMKNRTFIHPGDEFEFIDVFFAPTPEEAAKQFRSQMNWLPGNPPDGPFITVRSRQVYWVEPRKKAGGEESTLQSPVGKWKVKIGDWTGLFVFKQDGSCSWSESGQEHPGTWKIVGGEVQWTYKDDPKGWERVFHAKPLPLKSKMSGEATIKGVNHGYYEMSKLT